MAQKLKRASMKPSEMKGGGDFGFPQGSTVTITEITWTTWEEAGEKALKGGRKADDLALKIVGEVDGQEDARIDFLGGGKGSRLQPSKDGEFLEIPEGSAAESLAPSCNAGIFLNSFLWDGSNKKSDAFKRHGKNAIDESILDDGVSSVAGMKFVVDKVVPEGRDNMEGSDGNKPRATLAVGEIVKAPGKSGGGSSSKKKDKDEDEEKPARGKKPAAKDDDGDEADLTEAAEKAVVAASENPKYRKGLPVAKAFVAAHAVTKGEDNAKEIMELISDEEWLKNKKRPWSIEDINDEETIVVG